MSVGLSLIELEWSAAQDNDIFEARKKEIISTKKKLFFQIEFNRFGGDYKTSVP